MVQLIDVSSKIKVEDLKLEKKLLTVMNATVSHEIRNPLNALIAQITFMAGLLASFFALLATIKTLVSLDSVIKPIEDLYSQLFA